MPNELKGFWRPVAISAISILMAGFPMYFIHNNKPTMTTVSKMIRQEAPLAIENELRETRFESPDSGIIRDKHDVDQVMYKASEQKLIEMHDINLRYLIFLIAYKWSQPR